MKIYSAQKNDFMISTDQSKLNITVVHDYLHNESYWAKNIPIQTLQRGIDNSFCFRVYKKLQQVGFARLVTDYATYAHLCDVFILPEFRGNGLSKWLIEFILANPEVQGLRKWSLGTKDAHGLYAQFGFKPYEDVSRLMQKNNPGIYENPAEGI